VVQRTAVRPAGAGAGAVSPSGWRADLVAGAAALALVAAAAVVGGWLNNLNRPGERIYADAPPIFGSWLPHSGPGTPLALLVAVAVVTRGPVLAARLRWHAALALGYLAAVTWTFALALIDGWQRGIASRLTDPNEYLHEVPGVTDVGAMVRGFSSRILDFAPHSWTTHVAGHPPGVLLVFVGLDRIGLRGGGWAGVVCILIGCLAVVAAPVTLRALGSTVTARSVLPFMVLLPGAVWVGVSADGLFAGVTAAGIALLAVGARDLEAVAYAARRRRGMLACVGGGALLGYGVYLSYGLVLMAPLAAVVVGRRWRAGLFGVLGALAVVAVFTAAGFSWLDGYHLVVARYYQGIAKDRPYSYWVWANVAALALATGIATAAGLRRAVTLGVRAVRARARLPELPVLVLTGAALLAVGFADASGLSKAEVERIWLPFTVWLICANGLLPSASRRWWLAAQAVTALAVNHLLLTYW
jgi:methylthioxylose transferase